MSKYEEMIEANQAHLGEDQEMEVIIVNDSPWCEVEIDDGIAGLKVVKNPENRGIHGSRIHGLEVADGDYVIFLDQDDLLAEDAIHQFLDEAVQMHVDTAAEGEDCKWIIVANAGLEQSDGEILPWYRSDAHKALVGDLKTYVRVGIQIISPGQCLIPKKVIPEAWLSHEMKKNGADDYYLWLLLLSRGVTFHYLDDELYTHKYTGENLSADTTVTDESAFEFMEYLKEDAYFPKKYLKVMDKMLRFKDHFRRGNIFGKLWQAILHPRLMWINVNYKRATKTPYGFNR